MLLVVSSKRVAGVVSVTLKRNWGFDLSIILSVMSKFDTDPPDAIVLAPILVSPDTAINSPLSSAVICTNVMLYTQSAVIDLPSLVIVGRGSENGSVVHCGAVVHRFRE
jgi:hypothetical protein